MEGGDSGERGEGQGGEGDSRYIGREGGTGMEGKG